MSLLLPAVAGRPRFAWLGWIVAAPMLASIRLYQWFLSPFMGHACRFAPSCSHYGFEAVAAHGPLLGAWLLIFIPATRELSAAIFLYGPNTKVASVMIFDMSEEGNFERLAALALILQVLTLPLLWVGQKALGRDFMLRRNAT